MDNKVLAVVNGIQITEKDLKNALMRIDPNQRSYYESEQGRKHLLEEMISFELVYNNAKDNGEQDDKLFLEQMQMIKKDALIQYSIQKMLKDITVSEEEAKKFYEENKNQFNTPETVTAKHILVDSEQKAKDIAEEIKNGLSFEDAAKKYSKCPSKAQGGNLGSFARGQMVPEFEKAAFSLKIGVVSEPVKTQFGYHLIKVENKANKSIKEFKQVEQLVKTRILQDKQKNEYLTTIKNLRNKYDVKING